MELKHFSFDFTLTAIKPIVFSPLLSGNKIKGRLQIGHKEHFLFSKSGIDKNCSRLFINIGSPLLKTWPHIPSLKFSLHFKVSFLINHNYT